MDEMRTVFAIRVSLILFRYGINISSTKLSSFFRIYSLKD
jgi:hypothetical protein